jgi:catechol 2,3-dioxygenase-like lactoylglutathione lyase family enzyme
MTAMTAIARMRTVALDAPDPEALAAFYRDLLGWEITSVDPDWVDLAGENGWHLSFQRAPDNEPPDWPGADRPQQFHIDVTVDDLDEAEGRVLALGATKHEVQPGGESWRVYLDPAGHPFCLCRD